MNEPINALVTAVNPLTDSILQIILQPEIYIDYQAGQYLQILSQNEVMSFSIANAPLGSRHYELHIRHHPKNPHHQQLLMEIKQQGQLKICLPFGHCHLQQLQKNKPILFIAGGTGFAPIKAMIEQLLVQEQTQAFELFWGARSQSDLYMHDTVVHWQKHSLHFNYFSELSELTKLNLAAKILARHPQDLNDWQIVISGPFDMALDMRQQLLAHGVEEKHLFGDAFEGEPP